MRKKEKTVQHHIVHQLMKSNISLRRLAGTSIQSICVYTLNYSIHNKVSSCPRTVSSALGKRQPSCDHSVDTDVHQSVAKSDLI